MSEGLTRLNKYLSEEGHKVTASELKEALNVLTYARILNMTEGTASNGAPEKQYNTTRFCITRYDDLKEEYKKLEFKNERRQKKR